MRHLTQSLPGSSRRQDSFKRHEYGPFGEVLRTTGPAALANPFRFSTKYQDDETGLLYYGSRYYAITLGRWINRDPLSELGGLNLYCTAANNLVNLYDPLGLITPERLLSIMDSVFDLLNRINCDCPTEAAYLKCLIGELNTALEQSGFINALRQTVGRLSAFKLDVANATKEGLDPELAKQLERALNQLANNAGGVGKKANDLRNSCNRCIKRVTGPANTAISLYDGDSVNAAMTALEAIGALAAKGAGASLQPILDWIEWYHEAYNAATKALKNLQLNSLENSLQEVELYNWEDCDEINTTLGKNVYGPCKSKLGPVW